MSGANLYGSFRAGITFGSGDFDVKDYASRWGIKGSSEVSEGLTASYKFETKITMNNAESAGGVGHSHGGYFAASDSAFSSEDPDSTGVFTNSCSDGSNAYTLNEEGMYESVDAESDAIIQNVNEVNCGNWFDEVTDNGGPGGRLSYVSLSGGFGTVTVGQIWSASGVHYGFAVDPSLWYGSFGGAHYRNGNSISYSSSAGDVSFQIDKVTGAAEKIEFGASAALGPVGVGLGYWSNANDDANFTGVALSSGAAGVNLTIGLGGGDDKDGVSSDTSIINVGGALGDSGIFYAVQVTNADEVKGDQNLVNVTNSLGGGASIVFEHYDPGVGDAESLLALKVDF